MITNVLLNLARSTTALHWKDSIRNKNGSYDHVKRKRIDDLWQRKKSGEKRTVFCFRTTIRLWCLLHVSTSIRSIWLWILTNLLVKTTTGFSIKQSMTEQPRGILNGLDMPPSYVRSYRRLFSMNWKSGSTACLKARKRASEPSYLRFSDKRNSSYSSDTRKYVTGNPPIPLIISNPSLTVVWNLDRL